MTYFEEGRLLFRYHGGWNYEWTTVCKIAKANDEHKAIAILKCTLSSYSELQREYGIANYVFVGGNGVPLINGGEYEISSYVNSWVNNNSYIMGANRDSQGYLDPTELYTQIAIYHSGIYSTPPIGLPPYPYSGFYDAYEFTSTDLPIFNVDTQQGIDAFNKYQTTGDYSGAENYGDLPHDDPVTRNIYYKTCKIKGVKGYKGNIGICDIIPVGAVIAYDGDDVPEGYEEVARI